MRIPKMTRQTEKMSLVLVLVTGFYALLILWFVMLTYFPSNGQVTNNWLILVDHIEIAIDVLRDSPSRILVAISGIVIMGSLIRSISVPRIEALISDLMYRIARITRKEFAVHRSTLRVRVVTNPKEEIIFWRLDNGGLPDTRIEVLHSAFDQFETVLCSTNPQEFAFYETIKSRCRLFVGMIMVSVFGIIGGIIISWKELEAGLALVFLSTVAMAVFGSLLVHTRNREAAILVYCLLAGAPTRITQKDPNLRPDL